MGRRPRPRAERLNEKIRQIREAYGWTQPEFIRRLGLEGELMQSDIQAFEREPKTGGVESLPSRICC
jgi:transcriptional regulator with XRE-family HTH domain